MIDKILTLSTAHITEEDAKYLGKEESFSVGDFGFGFFMFTYIGRDIDELSEWCPKQYSIAFKNILKHARKKNCRYICLDCDADVIEDLQVFDW